MTQTQLAVLFENTQAWVSSVETGLTRLDTVQVWEWCRACGTTLTDFAAVLEVDFDALPPEKTPRSRRTLKSTLTKPKLGI